MLARRSLTRFSSRHGTGHGVGHYLCVHEGPQGIGTRIAYNDVSLNTELSGCMLILTFAQTKLKEGMVLSNGKNTSPSRRA